MIFIARCRSGLSRDHGSGQVVRELEPESERPEGWELEGLEPEEPERTPAFEPERDLGRRLREDPPTLYLAEMPVPGMPTFA